MNSQKIPAVMSWSGGKDSAFALHQVIEEGMYDVRYLLCTIDGTSRRLAIHEVPETLLDQQSLNIGIPLKKCYLFTKDNEAYEAAVNGMLSALQQEGICHIIFGDLFLEDLRRYREEKMNNIGMQCVFPLWQMNSMNLVQNFIAKGFKSIICSVNEKYLPNTLVGSLVDKNFLEKLPGTVDPCGENGEYHSFCYSGPIFQQAVEFTTGAIVNKSFGINQTSKEGKNSSNLQLWYLEMSPAICARKLICPRCKRIFECNGADITNCQCQGVSLSKEVQEYLEHKYRDCLCVACLQELAARHMERQ